MKPETIKLLAQMHDELMQDASKSHCPLETVRWAYGQICAGKDPWTGLGSFSHAWYGYAKDRRPELINDPLIHSEKDTEHTRRQKTL